MKKLTEEQQALRDEDLDWLIAQYCWNASGRNIWGDFSPTTNWTEAGPLIEKYQIDIRYFNLESNSSLEYPWMGGLQRINKIGLLEYFTAFGPTPTIAAMRALAKSFQSLSKNNTQIVTTTSAKNNSSTASPASNV